MKTPLLKLQKEDYPKYRDPVLVHLQTTYLAGIDRYLMLMDCISKGAKNPYTLTQMRRQGKRNMNIQHQITIVRFKLREDKIHLSEREARLVYANGNKRITQIDRRLGRLSIEKKEIAKINDVIKKSL